MIPREALAAALKPVLPKTWVIVSNARPIDKIEKTTVQIIQRRITRLPQAPIGKHYVGMLIRLATPEGTTATVEDRLDGEVDDFIHALDSLGIAWESAEKTTLDRRAFIYEIPVNVISNKKEK